MARGSARSASDSSHPKAAERRPRRLERPGAAGPESETALSTDDLLMKLEGLADDEVERLLAARTPASGISR